MLRFGCVQDPNAGMKQLKEQKTTRLLGVYRSKREGAPTEAKPEIIKRFKGPESSKAGSSAECP